MDNKSQSFRDVVVWQKAHAFTPAVYRASEPFPKHELFALTAQLRRSAAGIPANFVEGFRKRTTPDQLKFCNIAQSSADECLYHRILAHDPRCTDTTQRQANLEDVSRLLQGCINGLNREGS